MTDKQSQPSGNISSFLFPGMGQFMTGQPVKGVIILGIQVVIVTLILIYDKLPFDLPPSSQKVILAAFFINWFYSIIDAKSRAKKILATMAALEEREKQD